MKAKKKPICRSCKLPKGKGHTMKCTAVIPLDLGFVTEDQVYR